MHVIVLINFDRYYDLDIFLSEFMILIKLQNRYEMLYNNCKMCSRINIIIFDISNENK